MWIAAQIPPQTLMRFAVPIYVVGVVLLIAVALFGEVVNGARAGCTSACCASSPPRS